VTIAKTGSIAASFQLKTDKPLDETEAERVHDLGA
jgi:hypothetical protein